MQNNRLITISLVIRLNKNRLYQYVMVGPLEWYIISFVVYGNNHNFCSIVLSRLVATFQKLLSQHSRPLNPCKTMIGIIMIIIFYMRLL